MDKADGKDSAYYDTSQTRNFTQKDTNSDTSDDFIKKLLREISLLEYQNQLLQRKVCLIKQNCTLKQANIIATIISWFEDQTCGDVDILKTGEGNQSDQIQGRTRQDAEKVERLNQMQQQVEMTTMTSSTTTETVSHEKQSHKQSNVCNSFDKSVDNLRTVISGSKVVADLRKNVATLGNILKGLENISYQEEQFSNDQQMNSVGQEHNSVNQSGNQDEVNVSSIQSAAVSNSEDVEISKAKEKIMYLVNSTKETIKKSMHTRVTTDKFSNKDKAIKILHDTPETQMTDTTTSPTTRQTTSVQGQGSAAKEQIISTKATDSAKNDQEREFEYSNDTVSTGSDSIRRKGAKRSFLSTNISDDEIIATKKHVDGPLLSSTLRDDEVFAFEEQKSPPKGGKGHGAALLDTTNKQDTLYFIGNESTVKTVRDILNGFTDSDENEVTDKRVPLFSVSTATIKDNSVITFKDQYLPLLSSTAKDGEVFTFKHQDVPFESVIAGSPMLPDIRINNFGQTGNVLDANDATEPVFHDNKEPVSNTRDSPLLSSTAKNRDVFDIQNASADTESTIHHKAEVMNINKDDAVVTGNLPTADKVVKHPEQLSPLSDSKVDEMTEKQTLPILSSTAKDEKAFDFGYVEIQRLQHDEGDKIVHMAAKKHHEAVISGNVTGIHDILPAVVSSDMSDDVFIAEKHDSPLLSSTADYAQNGEVLIFSHVSLS